MAESVLLQNADGNCCNGLLRIDCEQPFYFLLNDRFGRIAVTLINIWGMLEL